MFTGAATAKTISFFSTAAVNPDFGRSTVLVPVGLGPCSELGTHQRGQRPAKAHLLHEQNPAGRRDPVFAT
ncbi:hypothetical protein AAC387_Pa10g0338 [Persea americana]